MNASVLHHNMASDLPGTDTRILIVDDSLLFREMAATFLRENDFTCYETAQNGIEAIEKAKSFLPNFIILDLMMPDMDGFACCRALRALDDFFRAIPILIMSGNYSTADRIRVLENGATDILSKPFSHDEFLSKIAIHTYHYRTLQLLEQQRAQGVRDDVLARVVQSALLPNEMELMTLEAEEGIKIHSMLIPSDEIGGDFWGVHQLSDHRLAVYLFDFSGHGVNAAVSAYLIHIFLPQVFVYGAQPDDMLALLNRYMCSVMPYGQYAVAFLAILDTQTHRLSYAGAGTYPALLATSSGVSLLDGAGQPLGLFPDSHYELNETVFETDALLVLHSDAIVEQGSDGLVPFTQDELIAWIKGGAREGAEAAFQDLLRRLTSCAASIEDDLTCVLLSYRRGYSAGNKS